MTSEGQQHPGYEPEDAGPDAGGHAPYGTSGPRFGDELPRRRADRGQQQHRQPGPPADDRGGWPPADGYGVSSGGWPSDDPAYPAEREQADRHTPTERWSRLSASSYYQPSTPPIPTAGPVPAPLPPQETRIPGVSLSASDYPGSDGGYPPSVPAPRPASEAPATGRVSVPQPTQHPAGPSSYGGGTFDRPSSAPPSAGLPTSSSPAAGGAAASASASVPTSNRALPTEDGPVPPAPAPPQPRVYGRPATGRGADDVPEGPYPPRGPLPPHGPSRFPPPSSQPDQYGQRGPYGPDAGPGAGRGDEPGQHHDQGFGPRGYSDEPGQHHDQGFGPRGYSDEPGQHHDQGFGPRGFASAGAGLEFPDAPPNGRPNPPGVYGTRVNPPDEPAGQATGRAGSSAPSGIPLGGSGTYGASPGSPGPQGFGGAPVYPGPPDYRADRPTSPSGPAEAFRPGPSGWGAPAQEREQGRFGSFRPAADDRPAADEDPRPPAPKERNGRVLAMVLAAAVLLLVIPLGLVWVFTRSDGTTFDPAVGECIKQSGDSAVTASCTESGAYVVQSKVNDAKQCPDAKQPHVAVPGGGANQILCLAPAPGVSAGASGAPAPSAS
jgi:hypothetical protein